jgi:CBS domain-containing protein
MDVQELMTAPVHSVSPRDTLNCAARFMRDHAVGCLPVVDDDGRLVGILTDRDIAMAAYEIGEALWKLAVESHMHTPVYTIGAGDSIGDALKLMRTRHVRRLPVVDADGRPIGLLSLDDIVHASRQPVLDPTPGLTSDEVHDAVEATSGRSKHVRPEVRR